MFNTLKTIALSAMIGAGSLAAVAPAQADSLYFSFGDRNSRAGIVIGDGGHVRHWDRDRNHRRDWRESRRGCSPERALNKASRMGINRVRIADIDRDTITVRGRDRGDRVRVTFAREPGCPIIG